MFCNYDKKLRCQLKTHTRRYMGGSTFWEQVCKQKSFEDTDITNI